MRTCNRIGGARLVLFGVGFLLLSLIIPGQVQAQTVPLTQQETLDLLYLREEEKLARDVYLVLSDMWKIRIFTNIAKSEQNHMDAVEVLLDRYGLADPAMGEGQFTPGSGLQGLYDNLIAQGSISLTEALVVGVIIEKMDITDLKEFLARTNKFDLQTVYNNLLDGSENHLAAFTSQLAKRR